MLLHKHIADSLHITSHILVSGVPLVCVCLMWMAVAVPEYVVSRLSVL